MIEWFYFDGFSHKEIGERGARQPKAVFMPPGASQGLAAIFA